MQTKKLNILHLHTYLNRDCGITEIIYQITSDSASNNHFVLALGGNSVRKFSEKNIKVIIIKGGKSGKPRFIRNYLFINRFIKDNQIDIIHTYCRYFDFLSYFIAVRSDIKTIMTVQSIVRNWKYLSYKSEVLIVPGKAVMNHLTSYFGKKKEKIILINNSIDLSLIKKFINPEELKRELGIGNDLFVVGYIGRMDYEEKGLDILIKSFRKFNINYPDSKLILIGSGKKENEIKNYIAENSFPAVHLSYVENIYDYLNLLNVLILPSRIDPFPLTMLSCGAAKIPFIGASIDGIQEMIKDEYNGLLFMKENVNDLYGKILKYYLNRELAEYCASNLQKDVLENYSSIVAVKKYNELYMNLFSL